ncbi:sortase [Patescibacteria group bacterium]|nr:sortase [Patescibacteria group bacterium]
MATLAKQVIKAARRAYAKKYVFLGVYSFVLFFALVMLQELGVAPYQLVDARGMAPIVIDRSEEIRVPADAVGQKPLRIEIPKVGIEASVNNPESTDIAVLDDALLSGTVRYPTSATLGEEGNVVIFGHSSHLPVVHNQAFKAFNDIEKLVEGDTIIVYGETYRYIYAVETVEQADANSDLIPLAVEGSKLTLSTCDTFRAKSARFVVTATLVLTEAV